MKCKKCQNEMKKDDVDFKFKGCYDVYWLCENCNMACKEKVRYGKTCKYDWDSSECNDLTFEEQLENIKSMRALCELETGIKINGVDLEYEDFGNKEDICPYCAEPYGCGDMQFLPFDDVKKETLEKYNINEEQYRQIQEKLDCLSFGSCGWCV